MQSLREVLMKQVVECVIMPFLATLYLGGDALRVQEEIRMADIEAMVAAGGTTSLAQRKERTRARTRRAKMHSCRGIRILRAI